MSRSQGAESGLAGTTTAPGTPDQELLVSAFDDAIVGIAIISIDGRLMRVNRVLTQLLGRPADELVGRQFSDVTHVADLDRNAVEVGRLLTGQSSSYRDEKRYMRPDGSVVWAALSLTLVRDAADRPMHFIVQVIDITERKALERERDATSAMLRSIIENSQSLIYVKDLAGKYLLANEPFLQAFSVSEQELLGRDDSWLDPELEPVWRQNDLRARNGAYRVQEWSDGRAGRYWYESVKFPLHDSDGTLYATCGISVDVTALHAQREDARRASALSQAVLTASPDFIGVTSLDTGETVFASKSLAEFLGLDDAAQDASSPDPELFVHPDDQARVTEMNLAARDLADGDVLQIRYRARHADRRHLWISTRLTPFRRDGDGKLLEVLSIMRDITDAVAVEEKLKRTALHDPLTGLPNRILLADRLTGALARAARTGYEVAVLYCDLDGFKRVNDSAGHAAGDHILLEAAERLRAVLREQDTVARLGGDEFVVVVEPQNRGAAGHAPSPGSSPVLADAEGVSSYRTGVMALVERISAVFELPFEFDGLEHVVTASVGVAYAGGAGASPTSAEELLQQADAAMYAAKARGRDCYEVYGGHLAVDQVERTRVERALRSALSICPATSGGAGPTVGADGCRIDVAYQPVFSNAGRLVGFEALARLTANGESIPPDVFIPIAEETGLIRPLGRSMLDRSCRQLAEWRGSAESAEHITMAVNLSAREAQHPELLSDVFETLSMHGLTPHDLVLELTESVLLEAAHATLGTFRALHAAGVRISIDDFGTGHASLRYLATLPVSAVKIDRSFTAGIPGDQTCVAIVRAVAGLAADLGLECVAEGVETDAQRQALPPGVFLQGWLLGRPSFGADIDLARLLATPYHADQAGAGL